MFDFPVKTKIQRKLATEFRKMLLDTGFLRMQYSVYLKWFVDKDKALRVANKVSEDVPPGGSLEILLITDKQYENIIRFHGDNKIDRKNPDQLSLF